MELDLDTLQDGNMPGLTPRAGGALADAAITCLEQEKHRPQVEMAVEGDCRHLLYLRWRAAGDASQRARTWGDPVRATEDGACGIAMLLISQLTDHTVVEMARRGPGFDYWLGSSDDDENLLFQRKARLEVSGIRRGNASQIERRVREKLIQIEPSDGPLPGVVVVVEFGCPCATVRVRNG